MDDFADFGATPMSGNLMKPPYFGSKNALLLCSDQYDAAIYIIGFLKIQYPGIPGMAPSFRTTMDFQLSPQIIQN